MNPDENDSIKAPDPSDSTHLKVAVVRDRPGPKAPTYDPVDITLQLRVDKDHPVFTEDFLLAEVNIGGYAFTLDRVNPMRPAGERTFLADYTGETDHRHEQ